MSALPAWSGQRTSKFESSLPSKGLIVTRDSDFNDLAVLRGAPPQVIRLRIANCRNDHMARLLIDRQDELRMRLEDPAIALVELTNALHG